MESNINSGADNKDNKNAKEGKPMMADDQEQPDEIPGVVVMSNESEQQQLAARLREAREYIGLLQEDVAGALDIPRASVSALESGKRRVSALELRRLARLYRRPVGWLLGEDVDIEMSEQLARATEPLSDNDKEQILRFAEFIAGAGRPGAAREDDDG